MTDLCECNPKNFVRQFLQDMCICDDFIDDVIECGVTIDILGKLESKGISCEDINKIRDALIEAKKNEEEKAKRDALLKANICDDKQKDFVKRFLKDKGLCEDFITEVLEYGLTDELTSKLPCNCQLSPDDVEIVRKALADELGSDFCDCSFKSHTSSSSRVTNQESEYLQEKFGNILTMALREVTMKKPYDPIEYLGHWLLFYRECEEREKRRKEFEAELLEERLKYKTPSIIFSIGEEESLGECSCDECPGDIHFDFVKKTEDSKNDNEN